MFKLQRKVRTIWRRVRSARLETARAVGGRMCVCWTVRRQRHDPRTLCMRKRSHNTPCQRAHKFMRACTTHQNVCTSNNNQSEKGSFANVGVLNTGRSIHRQLRRNTGEHPAPQCERIRTSRAGTAPHTGGVATWSYSYGGKIHLTLDFCFTQILQPDVLTPIRNVWIMKLNTIQNEQNIPEFDQTWTFIFYSTLFCVTRLWMYWLLFYLFFCLCVNIPPI